MKSTMKLILTKILSILVIAAAVIIALQPGLLLKLYNLVCSLVAAALGVAIGLLIYHKTINYVVEMFKYEDSTIYPNGEMHGTGQSVEQRSLLLRENGEGDDFNTLSLIGRTSKSLKQLMQSLVMSFARSPIIQFQMRDTNKEDLTPGRHMYDIIKPLGDVPEKALQNTNYVCVSQNIDKLMLTVYEYTYRDYVETWYAKVSSDYGRLHKLIKADFWETFEIFSSRLSKVDVVHLVMDRFVKGLLRHFEELDATDPEMNETAACFQLHPCLRDRDTELQFLRQICEYILALCFPEHITRHSSSKTILREILAGLAFMPMIDSVTEPDYINQSILAYLQKRETADEEKTRSYMYAANYEDFIKIINESNNIAELQQIRYRIMMEVMHATTISSLKKDYKKAGKARSMAKGELLISRNLKRYINQCQVAKQQCEKRIRLLGGEEYGSRMTQNKDARSTLQSHVQLLSFPELMASPMARSYFLKYLKKIQKGSLLNYWNEVEIIRSAKPFGKDLAKIVSHIYQSYMVIGAADELPIEVDKTTLRGMQTCVVGNKDPEDFFKIQTVVYNSLEKDHYPSFVVSDFYTCQLMPQLVDEEILNELDNFSNMDENEEIVERKAAFGSRKTADGLLMHLQAIEDRLEYKAQALESLKLTAKQDTKVTRQLEQEISELQNEKLKQQLHIERTEAWWSRMGKWNASIEKVQLLLPDGESSKTPVYTIVVQCSGVPFYEATDDVSGWVVVRSLDEFHQLHIKLKEFRPWINKIRLPTIPMLRLRGLSDKFLESSKTALNDFLSGVLQDEILHCSELVYSFLSQSRDQIQSTRHQRTSVYPDEEVVPERGARKNTLWQIGGLLMNLPKDLLDRVLHSDEDDDIPDIEDLDSDDSLIDRDSIAGPLYELIGEIFEIRGLFRPLRQTMIIFVRLAFGGTINKQIHDTLQWLVSESMLTFYLQTFIDSMWPNGQLKKKSKERTENEKLQTALEVRVKILQNIPEALQSLVGQENARRGMIKIYTALQDKKLNKHLFYNLLTEMVEEIFPEIVKSTDEA